MTFFFPHVLLVKDQKKNLKSLKNISKSIMSNPKWVEAIASFTGTAKNELTFMEGDRFQLLEADSSGWVRPQNSSFCFQLK